VSRRNHRYRSTQARIAALSRWARTDNRTLATAAARAGFEARFEREVDPDGRLGAEERARRAGFARRAYFARLALLSAKARQR
jgi:hypothetical protein